MVLHMRSHRQVAYLALVAFASILLLSVSLHPPSRAAFTTYVLDKRPSLQWYLPYSSIPCDPVEQPGWPDLQQWYWATANAECPGDADLIHGLSSKTDDLWERFPEFRKKNILLAGDSVGRHLAETLCIEVFHQEIVNSIVPDFEVHYGWSAGCSVASLGLEIRMIHIYGMANTSDPAVNAILDKTYSGKDWDLQSRVHRWWNTTLSGFVPDYVQLNSGAWEYRYWFVRDILNNQRHDDLPVADRETNARMAIQSLQFFQDRWPKAKVWYMHMSMMNEDDLVVKKAHSQDFLPKDKDVDDPDLYPPLYTWRRQAQYRATMRTRLDEAGWDSLDYVQIQSVMSRYKFSDPKDVIHPQWAAKRIMTSMILGKIRRHVKYGI